MKDVAGQTLEVGDKVAIAITGYRTMAVGRILRFTPKGMKVEYRDHRYGPESHYAWDETFREPMMVCKVPEEVQ